MHENSMRLMSEFAATLPAHERLAILDVGAKQVQRRQGTYRDLFEKPGWVYVGADVEAGANVDVVLADPYRWQQLLTGEFDVVVSGQTLEHVARPWDWMHEFARVLVPGGAYCIIVPAEWPEHRFPVDCYRYLPDGMRALAEYAGLSAASCEMSMAGPGMVDTRLIGYKP